MVRRRPVVQAWMWAVTILVLMVGVVVVNLLRADTNKPKETAPPVLEPAANVSGPVEMGAAQPGEAVPVEQVSSAPVYPVRIGQVEILEDGLLVTFYNDTQDERSVVENLISRYTPLSPARDFEGDHCWAYQVEPENEQFELLVSGNIHSVAICGDVLTWHKRKQNGACSVYVRAAGGESELINLSPANFEAEPSEPLSGSTIIGAFPERGQFIVSQFAYTEVSAVSSWASVAVRRLSDKWRLHTWRKAKTERLELWDSHNMEKAAQVGPEALIMFQPSPLFGEEKDVFLVVEQFEEDGDHFMSAYSVEPLKRVAKHRLEKGVQWLRFCKGSTPNELVTVIGKENEDEVRFARIAYDAANGLTMERFEPGAAVNKKGWGIGWHNGSVVYRNPPEGELTVVRGDEKVVACNLKCWFAVNDDGTLIVTWTKDRFDLWDVRFPSVTHRVGYRAVREQGTDNLRFEPKIAPPAEEPLQN